MVTHRGHGTLVCPRRKTSARKLAGPYPTSQLEAASKSRHVQMCRICVTDHRAEEGKKGGKGRTTPLAGSTHTHTHTHTAPPPPVDSSIVSAPLDIRARNPDSVHGIVCR